MLFSGGTRYNGHKMKDKEFYLSTKPHLFSCEDGQTLEWVSQRDGFFVLGDARNLTELGPEQPAVDDPALRAGAELGYLQRSLSTSAVCDISALFGNLHNPILQLIDNLHIIVFCCDFMCHTR